MEAPVGTDRLDERQSVDQRRRRPPTADDGMDQLVVDLAEPDHLGERFTSGVGDRVQNRLPHEVGRGLGSDTARQGRECRPGREECLGSGLETSQTGEGPQFVGVEGHL